MCNPLGSLTPILTFALQKDAVNLYARLAGLPILISKRGGGILASVNAVKATTEGDFCASLQLCQLWQKGTTTIRELKSGYGLDLERKADAQGNR